MTVQGRCHGLRPRFASKTAAPSFRATPYTGRRALGVRKQKQDLPRKVDLDAFKLLTQSNCVFTCQQRTQIILASDGLRRTYSTAHVASEDDLAEHILRGLYLLRVKCNRRARRTSGDATKHKGKEQWPFHPSCSCHHRNFTKAPIDSHLQLRQMDMLYSVAVKDHPTLLYTVFEAQRTLDKSMSLRLLTTWLESGVTGCATAATSGHRHPSFQSCSTTGKVAGIARRSLTTSSS